MNGGGPEAGRTGPLRFGRYEVLRKIASGGMAEVYLCLLEGAEGFRKKYAVKVIRPGLSDDERFRKLFGREARIAATCTHPNLVQVFECVEDGGACCLAMEYVDGANLAEALRRMREAGLRPPEGIWRYWVEGILSGVGALHARGVIHRDISPANVLLTRGGAVKVTDFGIARSVFWEATTAEGLEGKLAYLSPELARGEEAGFSSDLFAAAVVSAEMYLPGRLFDSAAPELMLARLREFDPSAIDFGPAPAEAADVLRKALAPSPGDRFGSAEEFGGAVAAAVPTAAGRAELAAFWDSLFAAGAGPDEETILSEAPARDPAASAVRERRADYGAPRRRGIRIAVAASLAAAGLGGAAAWMRSGDLDSRGAPAIPAPPVPSVPARGPEPAGRGAAAARGDEDAGGRAEKTTAPASRRERAPAPRDPSSAAEPAGRRPAPDAPTAAAPTAPPVAFGTIEGLNVLPWAKVYDGERELGVTPIRRLSLPVGTHRLRLVNEPLGVDVVETVTVRPGVNPRIIVSLEEKVQVGRPAAAPR